MACSIYASLLVDTYLHAQHLKDRLANASEAVDLCGSWCRVLAFQSATSMQRHHLHSQGDCTNFKQTVIGSGGEADM